VRSKQQQQQQHNTQHTMQTQNNTQKTQEQLWQEQEARVRALVMRALVTAKKAALQQLAQTKAQLAQKLNAQTLQLLDFEADAAECTINSLFAQAVEKLEDTVAEVLTNMELDN
jgi:hypothetical protein